MNAPYHQTGKALAAALLCQPRAKQSVRIVSRDTLNGITFYLVAVNETPERYRVSQAFLDRLHAGQTPEYLELEDEPIGANDEPEYAAADRASSAADRAYQFSKEQD